MSNPEPSPPRPRRIVSEVYGQALAEAGLIANINEVHRIVVDVRAGRALTVWVEYFADERWLDILPGEGVMVRDRPVDDATTERLAKARQALIEVGFFTEDQVGDDIAPRIVELVADLRRNLSVTQRATAAQQEKVVCYRIGGRDVDPAEVEIIRQPVVDAGPPDDLACQAE